jgi:hypothetical protein
LLHISCTLAATAANENGVPGASVSCNGTDIDNNYVLREGDLLQNRNYTATQQSGPDTQQCLHNSQFAANENRYPPKPAGLENVAPSHPPIDCCNCSKPAANVQQTTAPAAKDDRTIRVRDYKPLDPPEPKIECYACGKKGSWYVEKLTADRKARSNDQQDARRICKACYKEAVREEQMASVPLPGTIEVSQFNRVMAEVGKCSVCVLEKASWIDRLAGVKLCEHCYSREMRSLRSRGVPV